MSDIELGGRRFRVIDFDRRTALNDDYLQKLIRATGADKVQPEEGESNEAYLSRLQMCLIDSLRAHELVAGLLLEPGQEETDFTVRQAQAISEYVAKCNSPDDRALIKALAMRAVTDFFREGLGLLQRFRDSLQRGSEAKPSAAEASTVPV